MRLHHVAAYLCAAGLLASAAGCDNAATPTSDSAFTLAIAADPQSLDPHGAVSTFGAGLQMARFLYDPLVNLSADGTIVSGLAKDWQTSGSTITFHLRDGITCSDGEQVTASLVADNFTYVLNPKNGSPTLGTFVPTDLKVSSDNAAKVLTLTSTSTPSNFVLVQLTGFGIVCPAGLKDRKALVQRATGTGPYTVTGVAAGREYRLKRREGYQWGPDGATGESSPETVVVRVIDGQTTAANLLLSGEINAAAVGSEEQERLQQAGLSSFTYRLPIGQLWFNQRQGHLTADQGVRTALVQALNLDELSKVATGGTGVPSRGMLAEPLICGGVDPAPHLPKFNTTAAESALRAQGWTRSGNGWVKDGRRLAVTMMYLTNGGSTVKSAAELAAKTWTDFGVQMTLRGVTVSEFSNTLFSTGNWDVEWGVTYPQVPTQLMPRASGPEPPAGRNFAGIRNQHYARLAGMTDASASTCRDWNQAETNLYATAAIVPLADMEVPVFANGATFAVGGIGGQVQPTTIRLS